MSNTQTVPIPDGYEVAFVKKGTSEGISEPQGEMFSEYDDLMTPTQVAKVLHRTPQSVNDLCRRGIIPSVQTSMRRRLIPKSKLQRWIENGGHHV